MLGEEPLFRLECDFAAYHGATRVAVSTVVAPSDHNVFEVDEFGDDQIQLVPVARSRVPP